MQKDKQIRLNKKYVYKKGVFLLEGLALTGGAGSDLELVSSWTGLDTTKFRWNWSLLLAALDLELTFRMISE